MKKIFILLGLMGTLNALSQTPTYRWVGGSQEARKESTLELTEPSPRQGAASFQDLDGNYWLFGGQGLDMSLTNGFYNDLWKYDRASETWEWINGQMTVDRPLPEYNNSLTFDGVDDKIILNDNPISYDTDYSVELWFKTETDGVLISWSPENEADNPAGWGLEIVNGGTEFWVLRNNFVAVNFLPSFNMNDGEWHHVALTVKNFVGGVFSTPRNIRVYLDGEIMIDNQSNLIFQAPAVVHKPIIGARQFSGNSDYFTGQIDEVRFWSDYRTEGEIKSNYKIELQGNEEDLAAYYNFNQGVANSNGNSESELIDVTADPINGPLGDIYRDGVFVGQMAAVRVWDSSLGNQEIAKLANVDVIGNESGLLAAYDFTDGVPDGDNTLITTISDLTVNARDGSLQNFDLINTGSNFGEDNLGLVSIPYANGYGGRVSGLGDFDEDTYDDVVTINNNSAFSLFLNDQAGGLEAVTTFDLGSFARGLTVGNWNGDTHLDVAIAGWGTGTDDRIRVFFGDGTGDFPSTIDLDPGDNSHPQSLAAADLNGDTFDDLVVGTYENHLINIYLSDGKGGFGAVTTFDVELLYSESISLVDVNNDTFIDVVFGSVFNNAQGRIHVLLNDGTGAFADQGNVGLGPIVTRLSPIDLDQDGFMDFITGNGSRLTFLKGNGDGSFTSSGLGNFEINFGDITPLRFVGENLEFIVSSAFEQHFYLFEATPNGVFTQLKQFNTNSSPGNIQLSDMDKNGIVDLVINQEANYVNVMLREEESFDRIATNQLLDFDGINDHVEIPDLRPFDNSFTWEGWIKTEDNGPIFSFAPVGEASTWSAGSFSLVIKNKQLVLMIEGISDIEPDQDAVIADNEWHHVAVSISASGGDDLIQTYVDGSLVSTRFIDVNTLFAVGDLGYVSKLGYATGDFKDYLGSTGQVSTSNWTDGVSFPEPNGGRAYSAYWSGVNGKFYAFGGQGTNGLYNAIKEFDPVTEQWTTIKGIDAPNESGNYGTINISTATNIPPVRFGIDAAADPSGKIWVFGGIASDDNLSWLNDLWMYDPLLNEWVWMSGASVMNQTPTYGTIGVSDPLNVPGARENHKIWSDSDGNIWIFGGYGYDTNGDLGYLNDLWKFDTVSLEWTWIDGSNLINQKGEFSALDVYNTSNQPGARAASLHWVDSNGIVWIFGGFGYDKFGLSVEYLNDLWSYDPQIGEWAWHSGSDFANSTGSYNETGLSSTDYVPGARRHSISWTDEDDKLWLFGGFMQNSITTGLYNDFWKYEPETKEWTWLNGVNGTALSNELGNYGDINSGSLPFPGARHGGLSWTDFDGNFWILGGGAIGSSGFGFFNDLWKYEPAKEKWKYLGGSTELEINDGVYGSKGIGSAENEPRARWHGASWTGDDGKLWFFGGIHHNQSTNGIGWINDLWFFDPASNVYTWMGGSSGLGGAGVYGTKGEASAGHIPGARSSSAYWQDPEGNFWLFGGYESFEYNNDLWKFNPSTLEWTWVSGNNFQNTPGTYGQLGVESPSNVAGARRYTDGRIDQDGNVWVFGGDGLDSQAQLGWLNDLWKYNPANNTWTWMSGSKFRNSSGNFGVKGVASLDNAPPSRYGHASWIDDSGNVWIFGGYGLLGEGVDQTLSQLNDLWKFDVSTNMWAWIGGGDEFDLVGEFGAQGVFDELNVIPGKARAQVFQTYNKSLWLFGGRQGTSTSFNDFWQIKFTPGIARVETPSEIIQTEFSFEFDEPWAREYQVQVALTDDFSDTFYDEVTPNPQSTIGGLEPGTYYYYRVDAINEIGNSGFTPRNTVLTLPATPTFASLQAALTDLTSTQVYLDWEVTEGILDGYYIDVSRDASFTDPLQVHEDFSGKLVPEVQRQEISNLTPGTRYYARLQSYNASGVSPYSQVIPFLTKPATVIYPEDEVTEVTQISAIVNWESVPEIIDNYRITVSTLDDGFIDESQFLTNYNRRNIPKDRNTITVSGLAAGTSYFAVVSAVNASGESEQPLKITILTAPSSPVFAIETAILSITQNDVVFNWDPPQGFFEGYFLEVSTDFSFANTNLMLEGYGRDGIPFQLGQGDLTTTVEGLLPGQTYYARMRAYNSAGTSPNSNILTLITVPRAPNPNNASNISQVGASINWQTIQGADVYLIDLNESAGFEEESSLFTNFPLAVPFQVLTDLTPGTRYYARVQSSNISGNSGDMDPADYGYTDFITIPGTPILNGVDEYTQNSFTVSWPAVEGAAAYEVDVSDNFFQTFLVGFNGTTIADPVITVTNLDAGSDYQIRIRAKNESGKSPNVGIFDLLTLPETPIARDATNSSASVFTANWDPSDGAEYYALEVSNDDFVTFHYNDQLTSSNPVQITNLSAGQTYKYRVKSGNTSGESPYSNTVTVVAQNTAQSLNISSLTFNDEFGETASSAVINLKVSGGLGDPTVTIRHKEILSNSWSDQKPMTSISPTEFEFTILSNMLDDIGVVFEIYADDGVTFIKQLDNTIKRTFTETNSESLPELKLGEWSMMSIPYVLEDNLVTSIFNELGDLAYKKKWRLMTYLDGSYQDQGVGFTRIELGRGYWFNSLNNVKINVGAGQTNSTIPFEMALVQGWNQIGNPYNVTINWDNILDDNSLPVNISELFIYDPIDREFKESSTLASFAGAFVFADQATVVSVNPAAGSSNGRIGDEIAKNDFEGMNWKKSLSLNFEGKSKQIAAIGMHQDGSMSKDRFDRLVVPRFENYLEMYTTDESYFYPRFKEDIKSIEDEYVWSFDLTSNYVSGYVTLEWDATLLEQGYLWLVDENAGRIIEMNSQSSYSFNFGDAQQFSVHYSTDPNYVVTPSKLTLGDAYPNPVNSKAYIPVFLPESEKPFTLQLNLFDLQGRMVKTIASGLYKTGVHVFELEIDNDVILKDGLYFYKVSFEDKELNEQQKKIFIKR